MTRPKVHEHPLRVSADDIDVQGHVNNVVYLRYAQDAAVAHWLSASTEDQQAGSAWVARRHEIDYLRPAFVTDELLARTWVGEASGATFERFVEIVRTADGETLAKVRTVWVLLDPRTLRPRRVDAAIRAPFFEAEA
jgi:acyl-CoA thioester hydrolase